MSVNNPFWKISWTSQFRKTFIHNQNLCEICDPVFDGMGLANFLSRANVFLLVYAARCIFVFLYFPILFLSFDGLVWGYCHRTDRVSIVFFQPCTTDLLKIIIRRRMIIITINIIIIYNIFMHLVGMIVNMIIVKHNKLMYAE